MGLGTHVAAGGAPLIVNHCGGEKQPHAGHSLTILEVYMGYRFCTPALSASSSGRSGRVRFSAAASTVCMYH